MLEDVISNVKHSTICGLTLLYIIGAPYVFGAAIMVVAFLLTFFINREAAEGQMEDDGSTASGKSQFCFSSSMTIIPDTYVFV